MGLTKHLNLVKYAADSIFLHKTRTIAIVASLAIATLVLGSVVFLSSGLEKEAELSAAFAPDITVQILKAGRQTLVQISDFENLAFNNEFKSAPRVWGYISYESNLYTVMGIDPEKMPTPSEINFVIQSGRFIADSDSGMVVIGDYMAKRLSLKVGDQLTLFDANMKPYPFKVVGIFTSDVRLYTSDLILMNIRDARTFFDVKEGYATDLCVYTRDEVQARSTAQKLSEAVPNIRVLTKEALKESLITAYGARSGFVTIIWFILLIAVVLVAWNQASTLSDESRREVGLLKALGFNTMEVLEVKLLESTFQGVIAATIGVFLAIAYDLYLNAPVIKDFLLAWAQIYPEFQLPIYIQLNDVLILYLVAIFPLLAGSVIPSWLAAITEPDVAIRGV